MYALHIFYKQIKWELTTQKISKGMRTISQNVYASCYIPVLYITVIHLSLVPDSV